MFTVREIQESYTREFDIKWWHPITGLGQFQISADAIYAPADITNIRGILTETKVDEYAYLKDKRDCDNFALGLLGHLRLDKRTCDQAIFATDVLTPQGGHRLLSAMVDINKIYLIEPQNDSIFDVPADWALILLYG